MFVPAFNRRALPPEKGALIKTGQVAAGSGLNVKTLLYYANIGHDRPTIDTVTGCRNYGAGDIAKLQFVGTAERFDFSTGGLPRIAGAL